MIAHPRTEVLLKRHHGNRKAARAALRARMIATAKIEASLAGRSSSCQRGDHAGPVGCRNSGATCICECHDQAPEVKP